MGGPKILPLNVPTVKIWLVWLMTEGKRVTKNVNLYFIFIYEVFVFVFLYIVSYMCIF